MNIDHVHFYVDNAAIWRDWFVQILGFQALPPGPEAAHTHTEVVRRGAVCFWLSSARQSDSPVAAYLQRHPPGVVDVAFRVRDLAIAIAQAEVHTQVMQTGGQVVCQGWGELRHSLVPMAEPDDPGETGGIQAIDHVVLNVAKGELGAAIAFYEKAFGFERQQSFVIRTDRSALCSQVLVHPQGNVQLPINEPATAGSQIQEFLDLNRGAGIQHLALRTAGIVEAIARFRQRGLAFLTVPDCYYEALRQRPGFALAAAEWEAIARQEILVDWQTDCSDALLLQAFTQPIFAQPTFFFELIERRTYWTGEAYDVAAGFGAANFQALFEAMEREQMKRGSLS